MIINWYNLWIEISEIKGEKSQYIVNKISNLMNLTSAKIFRPNSDQTQMLWISVGFLKQPVPLQSSPSLRCTN